jgi:hypothetical protein
MEVLKKKEKGGQNQMKLNLAQKKWCIFKFHPHWRLMYFFAKFFFESHLVLDQTQSYGDVFS